MRSTRSTSRRLLAGTAGLAAAFATLSVVVSAPASANDSAAGLKINEVYGGGGNSGATFNTDFIELKNTSGSAISLGGLSLQYRSAASVGTAANLFSLPSVDVPAGDTYLVAGAGGATGSAIPTPDATSTLNLSGTAGQIFIATTTSGINPGAAGNISNAQVVDFVGYGTTAVSFEGTAPAPAPANPSSLTRTAGADTNSNSADFTVLNPATAPTPCGSDCGSTPPPPPTNHTIAEIQGTDTDTSPLSGDNVITEGVVTAAYPTGGFYGYVIQTDGTGSGTDATPGASDAIYVYQPSGAVTATIGDLVQVTGTVSEFQGLTELNVPAANLVDEGVAPIGVTPLAIAYPTTDAGREAHESELLAPTNEFTVTDNYSTNQYGEIGLATGDHQLRVPTDIANPNTDPAGVAAVTADNAARGVVLDDGSSINYLSAANQSIPLPWLSTDNPVRIGSEATLHSPVILDYRNGGWDFQPLSQVTDLGASVATFSDTRTANLAPQPVGGNLKLGTFNVLNYFNTTGKDWAAMPGNSCTYYNDRAGDPVTDNVCSGNGPRGAAESSGGTDLTAPTADVERQRVKEVKAINTMNADIVSLEEIENSVALGITDRDDALKTLVTALNADPSKPHPWAFVPSPAAADLPPVAEQDVIRTAFIYNPDKVDLVGVSKVLSDQSGPGQPFENAREPLAQEFKRKGAQDSDGFAVIVNHFKSKGSGVDDGTGQGNSNPDRIAQAHALVTFADAFKQSHGTDKVFLVGDFNSYTQEDPMQVLYGAGYLNQASDHPNDSTYEFGGQTGSLDHVLANSAAAGIVTGRDVWQIDAEESVGFEYSRYNYNATLLYQPNQFRASDHNPEVVGLDAPLTAPGKTATSTTVAPEKLTYGHSKQVTVKVTSANGDVPTGTVTLTGGGKTLGTGTLTAGTTSVTIRGRALKPGTYTLAASYGGDATHGTSTGTAGLRVKKATPKLAVTEKPHKIKAHKTRVTLKIEASAALQVVHGKITVTVGKHVYRSTLVNGKAKVRLKAFSSTGKKKIVVTYLGDGYNHAVTKVIHVRVTR